VSSPNFSRANSEGKISVHPYIFRFICTNGAIHARAVQSLNQDKTSRPDIHNFIPDVS